MAALERSTSCSPFDPPPLPPSYTCTHTQVLCAYSPFAVIMQLHPGWVGMLQRRYLDAIGCLWFNRTQARGLGVRARACVLMWGLHHVCVGGRCMLP